MPPLDPETMAMLQYYIAMQTQLDPSMQQLLGGMIAPNVNKYGELDMFGSDLQKSNLNQFQDIYGSLDDPMLTLLSGGGLGPAPLGGGVVGGGGLNPITTETIMETPATQQMQMLAAMAGQGGQVLPETYVANMLVNQNAQPSLIISDLMAKMADPNLDAATKNLFTNWLPKTELKDMKGNPTGETTIDWNGARKQIEDMSTPYLQEVAKLGGPNIGQNAYGQYVQYSEQPSPMMEYLQKLGLPDPRTQYGIDYAIQSDPELSNLMVSMGTKGQAFEEAQKAYKDYLKKAPQAQALVNMREKYEAERKRDYGQAMAKYAADMAEWAKQQPEGTPSQRTQEFLESRPDPGAAPGWIRAIGSGISDVASSTGDYLEDTASRIAGRPVAPPGAPTLPSDIGPVARALEAPMARPVPPTMGAPSVMERMLSGVQLPRGGSYERFKAMNQAKRAAGEDMLAMVRAIAPGYGAMRAGRTPFQDALRQRLQPLIAIGGMNG